MNDTLRKDGMIEVSQGGGGYGRFNKLANLMIESRMEWNVLSQYLPAEEG